MRNWLPQNIQAIKQPTSKPMTEILSISGMSCQGCVASVQKAISRLPVEKAEVEIGKAMVEFDESKVTHQQLVEVIEDAGFEVAATW